MFKFGFELEGFMFVGDGLLTIPPKTYPTDGFPGLVELRTRGAQRLEDAYADIITERVKHHDVDFNTCSATFDGKQRAELRRRYSEKTQWDIRNIYGKTPRLMGNKTIASLQINISNVVAEERTDDKGSYHHPRYGLFDVTQVIFNLDNAFENEIKAANRQPGEYCIKDNTRLEYRSLPNFAFEFNLGIAQRFLDKINECVNY